jgi:hypothetical protein
MNLTTTPPLGWDERIVFPLQSVGFAHAALALGHRPLFAEDERGIALVLIRQVPIPVLRRWTSRAKVYAHAYDAAFLPALVEQLRRLRVSHVLLGNSRWGVSGAMPDGWPGLQRIVYHVFVNDLRGGEAALLAKASKAVRRDIRKATSSQVTVAEVRTAADLRDYLSLTAQTGLRMRFRDVAAVYPTAYFEAILRAMVPRRQAVLLLARAGDAALAGGTFVTNEQRFAYFHGCSTRDRALTPKQGPTAVFWHAMALARAWGCTLFDMGAVTPTEDRDHPHYSVYEYKKGWGGQLETVEGGELIVSPWKFRFQEFVLAPMWDRLHPLYLRLFGDQVGEAPTLPSADAPVFEGSHEPVADAIGPPPVLEMAGQERSS